MKSKRKVQWIFTDKHGGFKLALMNPETLLFDQDKNGNPFPWIPGMTSCQEYLWKLWTGHIQQAIDIADGADVLALDLGDACHGVKYPQGLVSSRLSDQPVIAEYNMRPVFAYKKLKAFRQVIGTQAHNAGEGSLELTLAEKLRDRNPKVDVKPLYHGLLNFGGVSTDYAHHGPFPGSRNWLAGNAARFYLRDLMMKEIQDGNTPPDLVMRGHYHQGVYELLEQNGFKSELFVLPSYSMLNDHAIQATSSPNTITHGMVVVEIENGKILRHHRLYEKIDVRTTEVIND
jgi:hypothetical protein